MIMNYLDRVLLAPCAEQFDYRSGLELLVRLREFLEIFLEWRTSYNLKAVDRSLYYTLGSSTLKD